MNIEKLELTTYKNYKVLCEVLGEPVKKSGNSRDSQLKEWSRYFNFEKQGHKIIVTEIYSKPKPKQDGRATNGHTNFNEVLGDSRGHRPRVINEELIGQAIKLALYNGELNGVVYGNKLIVKPFDLFTSIGLCNTYASQLIYNKQDLFQNDKLPFYLCDYDEVDMVLDNLYNSMKSKCLCQYVTDSKLIVEVYGERLATELELELIEEVEIETLTEYNTEHGTKFKTYGDVFVKGDKQQKQEVQQLKQTKLKDLILDYVKDISCLIVDITKLNTVELNKQAKQQIQDLYYNNEVNRINNNYDKQVEVINNLQRARGNIKSVKKKQVENKRDNSLLLVRYSLVSNLTEQEQKQLKLALKSN